MIGPPMSMYQESSDEQQALEEVEEQIEEHSYKSLGIPVESFASLKGHKNPVTAVDIDPKGYRMVTGSLDYTMRMWDFHGMSKSMNSFRVTEPIEGNAIRSLHYNTAGTHVLVVCGGKQVMLADKDGAKGLLTVKGYMYIHNLHKTKGHTNTIYDGMFHPQNYNEFITCSGDGSIRLWDFEQKLEGIEEELAHKTLFRCLNAKNLMTGVTGVSYLNDGKMIVGGCIDGSLQVFSTTQNIHRPEMLVRDAHTPNEQYTKILTQGNNIYTRNMDGSLKIWDIRQFKRPIVQEFHLPNYHPGSKMCLSPDGGLLLVGTSVSKLKDEKESCILFMDSKNLDIKKKMVMGEYSITDIKWSEVLNQIVVGTTTNEAHIYFDKDMSKKGAMQAMQREPRVEKDPIFGNKASVYNPHSLDMYKAPVVNTSTKTFRKLRKDPVATQLPYLPPQGLHKQGKQQTTHNITQSYIQSINQDVQKVEDARIQILQLNGYTSKNQEFSSMYKLTQPERIFNNDASEFREIEILTKIKEICPHCGLKLCTCANKYTIDLDDDEEENAAK